MRENDVFESKDERETDNHFDTLFPLLALYLGLQSTSSSSSSEFKIGMMESRLLEIEKSIAEIKGKLSILENM